VTAAKTADATTTNVGKHGAFLGTRAVSTVAQILTVTPNGAAAITPITIGIAATSDTIENTLKNSLAGSGVDVVRLGDAFYLQSDKSFTTSAGTLATGAFVGGAGTVFVGAAGTTEVSSTPLAATDPTSNALAALSAISAAVTTLGNVQGKVGTAQNRLSYAIQLAQSQITSFSAAESRIRDADVASEAANLTKAQVLQQASLAALAQANSAPQAVLSLLRG